MPTGDSFVNLVLKRFLSQSRMNGNFLEYLQEMFYDGISRIFPNHGLFTYPYVLTNNGDGTFTIGTDPLIGTDGEGHILKLTGTDRTDNIPFEDTAATYYWIGMHYIEVPSGVYINPRTGQVEYDLILEEIGELDNPTSASDAGGGTIKLVVDSIFENGVDYSGREVTVWLTNPMSSDAAVAFETLTVSYDGGSGENSVTTTGLLGQASVSVATADYQVAALGVSVKKSATNPWTTSPYTVIGYVEGSTSNETTVDSNDLSGGGGHTLQKAYDGAGGAGDGRNVSVANEAIDLDQQNLTLAAQDVHQAALRITKDDDRAVVASGFPPPYDAKDLEGAIDVLQRMMAAYGFMNRVNLVDHSGSGNLLGSEAVDVVGNAILFTRGGVALTSLGNGAITPLLDIVQIVNSSNGNDGIYRIATVASATLNVLDMDGAVTSFTSESGTAMEARIYRPVFQSNALSWYNGFTRSSLLLSNYDGFNFDLLGGGGQTPLHILGADDNATSTPMIFVTDSQENAIHRVDYDGDVNMTGTLFMNNNDIDTEGGDVLSGGGIIDSEGGTIQSGSGIIDSEGGIIRSGGGNIDAEGGDIVTTGGNVAVTGAGQYVVAETIYAYKDVVADSNSDSIGDFKYATARQQWINVPIADFRAVDQDGTDPNFRFILARWRHEVGSPTDMLAPVHVPNGSSITGVRALVLGQASASVDVDLVRANPNWSVPAAPLGTIIGGVSNTSVGSWQLVSNTSFSELVDNYDHSYMIIVNCSNNLDEFGAVQIRLSYDTLTFF